MSRSMYPFKGFPSRRYYHFQRIELGPGCQRKGLFKIFERKPVGDEFGDGNGARKNQLGGFSLPVDGGAVTAEDLFFLHANGGGGKFKLHERIVLREEQHAPARARECQ